MALMTKNMTEPGTGNGALGPRDIPAASWTTSERYAKHHTYKYQQELSGQLGSPTKRE